jgi:hypothetical protein
MYIIEAQNKNTEDDQQSTYFLRQEYDDGFISDTNATYVTHEGYMAEAINNPDTNLIELGVYIGGEILDYGFEEDGIELQLAKIHNLTHYVFCVEFTWNEKGEPSILSSTQHMVLGKMFEGAENETSSFTAFVTALTVRSYYGNTLELQYPRLHAVAEET